MNLNWTVNFKFKNLKLFCEFCVYYKQFYFTRKQTVSNPVRRWTPYQSKEDRTCAGQTAL
jgi:hypothetical protein